MRRPGTIDLLDSTEEHPSDPEWRADALGKSRHSRLADEVRAPIDDPDPHRAELVCARITREVLGDYAPALLVLSAKRRRRTQALSAWTATLFDLARRPGLAGLDGDRLAQINAWEFQTEDALSGGTATQPIFVALAKAHSEDPWPAGALDGIVASARALAVGRGDAEPEEVARVFLEALYGSGASDAAAAARAGAPLLARTVAPEGSTTGDSDLQNREAPRGWRSALGYVRRVVEHQRTTGNAAKSPLGLAARLRYLLGALLFD